MSTREQMVEALEAVMDDHDMVNSEHPVGPGPDPDKVLSNSKPINELRDEATYAVQELLANLTADEFHSQDWETQESAYTTAALKARTVYLEILEILSKAHGYESYEAALEERERDAFEEADRKIYGGA